MSNTATQDLKYIELHSGSALVFVLQNGKLNVTNAGKTYTLTSSLTDTVKFFDVTSKMLSDKTQISIALVTQNNTVSNFYLTDFIEPSDANLNSFKEWTCYPLDESITVTHKDINRVAVSEYGMAIAVSPSGSDAYYCFFDKKTKKWVKYDLPENAPVIQELIFGTVYGDGGLFLLLQVGSSQTLIFQSFVDPKYGKISSYRFDCSEQNILAIDAVKTSDNNTQLYAVYDKGILLFKTPDADVENVLTSENDFLFNAFAVHEFSTQAKSIWSLEKKDQQYSSDKNIYYNLSYVNDMFPEMKFTLVIK